VSYDNAAWGIASGTVNGKTRVLFVGGAAEGADGTATPTRNALQEEFGGGWCDGYALLLDFPATPEVAGPPVLPPLPASGPQPTSVSFEMGAPAKSGKNAPRLPEDDSVFHFKPEYPRWVTVDAEFRDRLGKTWPSFLYGKPVEGTLVYHGTQLYADFTVACTSACQPFGDQDRRLLGNLFNETEPPQLLFTLQSLGEPKSVDFKALDKAGKEAVRTVEYCDGQGVLNLAGKKIEVTPKVTFRFSGPKDGPIDKVQLTAWLPLKAAQLGLSTPGTETEIDLRINMSGSTQPQASKKK